jgi:hypothetical protein
MSPFSLLAFRPLSNEKETKRSRKKLNKSMRRRNEENIIKTLLFFPFFSSLDLYTLSHVAHACLSKKNDEMGIYFRSEFSVLSFLFERR